MFKRCVRGSFKNLVKGQIVLILDVIQGDNGDIVSQKFALTAQDSTDDKEDITVQRTGN